jgi:hypothetical protein
VGSGANISSFLVPEQVTAIALGPTWLAYGVTGDAPENAGVWITDMSGRSPRRVVGASSADTLGGRVPVFAELLPSPDGRRLLYADVGDDGYSRAGVADVATGATVALSRRRDVYPAAWSGDGGRVLVLEGNVLADEASNLVSVRPDGGDRKVLVEGASR